MKDCPPDTGRPLPSRQFRWWIWFWHVVYIVVLALMLGAALPFFLWHESYHTGQLELLRQLAGMNDKVF